MFTMRRTSPSPEAGLLPRVPRNAFPRMVPQEASRGEMVRDPAAVAEKRKQRAEEEARTAARRRRFRELEAWCRAEGIRELAGRVK